jgi:uncharacterized membrane protein YecN with MAPEG domain
MSLAWQAFGLTAVALFLKMFAVAGVQGVQRMKSRAFTRPDDAAFFGKGATPAAQEVPIVERAQNTLRNDVENIPIFLFLMLAYAQLGAWPLGAALYGAAFVLARVTHTLAYLQPRQPLRNRAYLVGQLLMFVMSGHIVAAAFGG